jgi:hypothetical protein
VAESHLHHLGMLAGRKQQGGRGVPQVVKANIGRSSLLQERLEPLAEKVAAAQGAAPGVAESPQGCAAPSACVRELGETLTSITRQS